MHRQSQKHTYMKHKLFFILAGAAALSSCSNAIYDTTSDLMTDEAATKVDFEYVVKDANTRTVLFVSTSDDKVTNCSWLFGDNTTGGGKQITHKFAADGTYKVDLEGSWKYKGYTQKKSCTKYITLGAGSSDNPGGGTGSQVSAQFTYERKSPLMVEFTNTSTNAVSYLWEFGDGMFAYGKDATHQYESLGTYTVTLTVQSQSGTSSTISKQVALTEPQAYVDGFTFYAIPYEDKCYGLEFKDDNLLPSSWDWETIYIPLGSSDMPYTWILQTKKFFTNPNTHEYWTIDMRRSDDLYGNNEKSCFKGKFRLEDLKKYKPEYVWTSETGTCKFGIKMGYTY